MVVMTQGDIVLFSTDLIASLISNSCMRKVTGFTEHVSQRSGAESRAAWG
jgi:hypothetical protein